MGIQYVLLMFFIVIAFYIDITKGKIPNILTYSTILIGLIYHLIVGGLSGLLFSLLGMLIGFSIFILLYIFGAIGAGDVKLFAAIGSLAGIEFVLYCSMYSIIYAGVIGIIILVCKKEFMTRIVNVLKYLINLVLFRQAGSIKSIKNKESLTFPFMYAVLPAVITTLSQYLDVIALF